MIRPMTIHAVKPDSQPVTLHVPLPLWHRLLDSAAAAHRSVQDEIALGLGAWLEAKEAQVKPEGLE